MNAVQVLQLAREVGLDDAALVPAQRLDAEAAFMESWVAKGLHGNMYYLERNRELRYDPRELVPGAKTIVVGVLTYDHSGHDYHRAVKSKLYELEAKIRELDATVEVADTQHVFCDSAPFLERAWAVKAGLGFIGKNHQFIHPTLGSYVHLGELVLNTHFEPFEPLALLEQPVGRLQPSRCADCTKCLAACPGQALGQAEWDARRCVAYVTHRCEICQQVCPYNETIQ